MKFNAEPGKNPDNPGKNPANIEKKLVQKNFDKDKTRSYHIQVGNSNTYLSLERPKNSQLSESEGQKLLDQLEQYKQRKKEYYKLCEPLVSSNSSDDELDFLEGTGQVELAKNVDAFPVTPTYPGRNRPQSSGIIPKKPIRHRPKPRARSGGYPSPKIPPKLVDQRAYGGNGGGNGGGGGSGDDRKVDSKSAEKRQDLVHQQNTGKAKKNKRKEKSFRIGEYLVKLSYDDNGNPIYTVIGDNGQTAIFTYEKALEKYYHADVYNLKFPKGFDVDHARKLKPKKTASLY